MTEAGAGAVADAATLVAFAHRLRDRGLVVGTERTLAFCRAAAALGPSSPAGLYWAGRVTLVGRREDLAIYDREFWAHFASPGTVPPPPPPPAPLRLAAPSPPSQADGGGRGASAAGVVLTAAARQEVLRHKSFELLDPSERAETEALIARLGAAAPRRRSRRLRPAARGSRPDLARTLRRSLRTHGEPLEWRYRRRTTRPRRVAVLLDVSGSMGAYARSLARFAHAVVRAGGRVEAFAFGTRLTRITQSLRHPDPDAALAEVGKAVPDWQGGTRIGESLRELVDRWGRRGPLRGAVVIILSDGLDRGDPGEVGVQMRRLRLLAHRLVWVNPLKGSPSYQPLARGMAAALPYVDVFLPGHNLASLEALAEVLTEL